MACVSVTAFAAFALTCVARADSAELHRSESPIVIGFERFARHDELNDREAGRLLVTELSCAACHETKVQRYAAKGGPRLDAVGERLSSKWLSDHLSDPTFVKNGTTMPDVLHGLAGEQRQQVQNDLLVFLRSRQRDYPFIKATGAVPVTFEFWHSGRVRVGKELYHTVGCVACHAPDDDYEAGSTDDSPTQQLLDQLDPEELEELGLASLARKVTSIPLGKIGEKYHAKSLSYFLFDPAHTRPAERMPNLRLLPAEAADITAYLLKRFPGDGSHFFSFDQEQFRSPEFARGVAAFRQFGCSACHEAGGEILNQPPKSDSLATKAIPLFRVKLDASTGCLSKAEDRSVRFELDEQQIAAIRSELAAFQSEEKLSKDAAAADDLNHRLMTLNASGVTSETDVGGSVGIGMAILKRSTTSISVMKGDCRRH